MELETPAGKNDGSVGGVYYFQCLPKHGKVTWIIIIQYIESEQMQCTIPKADTLGEPPPPYEDVVVGTRKIRDHFG